MSGAEPDAPGEGDRAASVPPPPMGRAALTRVAIAFALAAVIVFLLGISTGTPSNRGAPRTLETEPAEGATLAATYGERMADGARGPDRRQRGAFDMLVEDRPPPSTALATDDERAAEVARRARLRAYDGAPPRIPHPVAQRTLPECLACHADGMRVAGHSAPEMPHASLTSCVQCHVVDGGSGPRGLAGLTGGPPADTSFVGRVAPLRGERAWAGAPPTVPHPTRMREDCVTCHGTLSTGIGSPHLDRQSCLQCHATSAALERPARAGRVTP